jgi:hypothetical protein
MVVLAIMLNTCVLTLVAFCTPGLFTVVLPRTLALLTAVLQSFVTAEVPPCIRSSKIGIATELKAKQMFFLLCRRHATHICGR